MTTNITNESGTTIAAFKMKPMQPVPNKKNAKQIDAMQYALKYRNGNYYCFHDILHVVTYTTVTGRPCAMYFWRDSAKCENYSYRDAEERTKRITDRIKQAKAYSERIASRKKARKEVQLPVINVGDVLATSWGYEQTNVDFFQVIARNGKTGITIQPIAGRRIEETSWCSDTVQPVKDSFVGEPMEKRISRYGVKIHSSATAYVTSWDKAHHRSWGY